MELIYANTSTYKYELDKERLDWITTRTKRSSGQTQFLYQLVDGDFEKLKALETKIKNSFYFGCPGDKEVVCNIMNLKVEKMWFCL